jgi:predicted nicotinamide N-methyase
VGIGRTFLALMLIVYRLELGAGGGLVGLALAIALNDPSETHIEITDQAQLLGLMEHNIKLNKLPPELVSASILDWGSTATSQQPDVLLAADCVYFEPAFPLLLQTLKQLMGPDTVCYFCFKKRRNADLHFVKDLKKTFRVEDVNDDPERSIWSRERLFMWVNILTFEEDEADTSYRYKITRK